ncbi:hypothetical protein Tco_0204491 [Tanacetum coccineum]
MPTCSNCKENEGDQQPLSTKSGDETLYQAWERFKELLMKCPQHYLTEMQEVILFYNGLKRTRSTKTSDGLAAIQAQLNNLGREIKKVNEKVYVAQVRCEQCKGPSQLHQKTDPQSKTKAKPLKKLIILHLLCCTFPREGINSMHSGSSNQRNNTNPSYQE